MNFSDVNNILIIGQDDITNSPITGGGGSGSVIASHIQTPINEVAKRYGVQPFESKPNQVQRHCDSTNSRCVIYAGGDCHTTDCIPDDYDYDAIIFFIGANSGEGGDRNPDQIEFGDQV